ncbi:MAG TPA: hypothetical protein VFI70_06900 [Nitrososphaeraceae archaeon]|nr:hypothetical protein [Nitrososphaeraceae archaeon]
MKIQKQVILSIWTHHTFDELDKLKSESIDKHHYVDTVNDIRKKLIGCMTESKLLESSFIDQNFVQILSKSSLEVMKTYKVSDKARLQFTVYRA